jgi:acyl carrier protein
MAMGLATRADVISTIETALSLEPGTVSEDTSMANTGAWDSLGHLNVLIALDSRLGGQLAGIKEMATATSVDAILDLLKRHSLI